MNAERPEFVHLHAHTEYSLLDGACRVLEDEDRGVPGPMLKAVAQMGMPALAMTDHGNLYGAMEFYDAAMKCGIKPILGMEAYIAPAERTRREPVEGEPASYHITLLAEDNRGWENLIRLATEAHLNGYYYKPRIDKEILAQCAEGLIVLSGCLHGEVAARILAGDEARLREAVDWYRQVFPGRYYLEIMDHGIPEEKTIGRRLQEIGREFGLPLVATNDCHYLRREDAEAHDLLLCIGTGVTVSEEKRLRYASPEFYYKSPAEMAAVFRDLPAAVRATMEVAERCNVLLEFGRTRLPPFETPPGFDPDSYLRHLCLEGAKARFNGEIPQEVRRRLDHELSVIAQTGFATYFLIVWDIVRAAREKGIPVGPGRGSAAGSLAAYCLGITDLNPLEFGLLFERFLNPARRELPDIDMDFSDERRGEVLEYIRERFGRDSVAQIITFGSMKAKLIVRDTARALGFAVAEADRIAGLIPADPGITLEQALAKSPELAALYRGDGRIRKWLDLARSLEGLKRHPGVHAAGVVIGRQDLRRQVPFSLAKGETLVTQFNDRSLLKMGLLKLDILGLSNLSVIERTLDLVERRTQRRIRWEEVPLDDKKTFQMLAEGRSLGTFQLDSRGMRDLMRKLRPTVLSDIIALIALYRPGPMELLPTFIARKHGHEKVTYDHPALKPILEETYGVMVYQEQVMQIAQTLGGFSPEQADILRSALAKKVPEKIEKLREDFLAGAKKNGVPAPAARKIFQMILNFGGYGFNRSHAAAYGITAYRTAWLKANHPLEYMCSLLTSEIGRASIGSKQGKENKLLTYLREAQAIGLEILPPDVNASHAEFSVEGQAIRYALTAIKNIGEAAANGIVAAREKFGPFRSLLDFCYRMDRRLVNRRVIESLIQAGCFDSIQKDRAFLFKIVEHSLEKAEELAAAVSSQTLFRSEPTPEELADPPSTDPRWRLRKEEEWREHEVLRREKEVLGFYLTGHPLAWYQKQIQALETKTIAEVLSANGEGDRVRVAGVVLNVIRQTTRNKETMARFRLEDLEGEIHVVVFPRVYAQGAGKILKLEQPVVITGRLQHREDQPEIIAEEVLTLEQAQVRCASEMRIRFATAGLERHHLEELKKVLAKHRGRCRVRLYFDTRDGGQAIVDTEIGVEPTSALIQEVEKIAGVGSVDLVLRAA